ncbi:phosphopyruvate hydratase [Candidatus Micrarchaeota archaeon]|nr:phosphopyruvate hydratase [Candidatus Micrarchaeota archaeon]
MRITAVWAREILDSRGNPTVEVDIVAETVFASAAAPSGASTGKHEAVELRDKNKRYLGKGVLNAVNNVRSVIAPALVGMEITDQEAIDRKLRELDGTKDKSHLGANAMVATSMAAMKAAAASQGKMLHEYLGGTILPKPMFNILNGGLHAGNELAIQEFMIIPDADQLSECIRMASEIYHVLGKQLVKKYGKSAKNVGDEGGYAPPMKTSNEACDAIMKAIEETGYKCSLALDAAASSFCNPKGRIYTIDGQEFKEAEFKDYYSQLVMSYPIRSIEDPFYEESFGAFAALKEDLHEIQIVGDDLIVTNASRLKEAISENSITALLLKVNQIGTVSEALEAVKICKEHDINIVVSHRSGETEDCFIADFSVGIDAGQIKTGAPARGERTAKYNQLLRIEERMQMQD